MTKKLFFLVILLHITAWLALKPVWPFSDDYCYAFHAFNFNTSFHLSDNVFQNRFGVYMPVSGIFYLFGISPYSISLWPLLASLLTITLIFILISKYIDEKTALISAFLISMNILQLTYSTALFPDIFIELYATASILFLYLGREIKTDKQLFPLLSAACIFMGILTKETIALVFPFFLFIAILDIYKKQGFLFWKRFILYAALFTILYFTLFYFLTGDFFYKLNATVKYDNTGLYNMEIKEYILSNFENNIFKWLNSDLAIIFILLFATASILTIKKYDISDFKVFISTYAFLLLLIFAAFFCSDKYGVLFRMDRIWMLCIPPLCILTASYIKNIHLHFCIILIVSLSILTIYNFYIFGLKRGFLFALFLTTTLITYYLSRKNSKWNFLTLVPFILLSIRFVWSNSNYWVGSLQSGDLIKEQIELLNSTGKKTILTDGDFSVNHIIYNGFKEYSNLTFYSFSKYDSLESPKDLYVIINNEEFNVPDFIIKDLARWKKEFDSDKLMIYKREE